MLQVIFAVIPIPHLVSSSKKTLVPTLAVQTLTVVDVISGGGRTFVLLWDTGIVMGRAVGKPCLTETAITHAALEYTSFMVVHTNSGEHFFSICLSS